MVPMNLLPAGGSADYIVTGAWSQKAVKEAKRVGGVKIAASTEAENFARVPQQERADARSGRGVRAHTRRTTRSSAPSCTYAARRRRRAARRRHLVRHVQPSDRRVEVRAHLRRRAEEPRRLRASRSSIIRDDMLERTPPSLATMLQLQRARGEQVDVQHAAGVRDLHHAAGADVAAEAGRARRRSRSATRARPTSCTPRSIAPASIAATRRRTAARG